MAAEPKGRKNTKPSRNPAKSAAILKAAETIFSRKGFHSATIAEIAKKAKVSEATIYEYFSSKEELLFTIPAETTYRHYEKNQEILPYIHGAANKLRFLIRRHLELYAENPSYADVIMLIIRVNRNFLETDAYQIVRSSAQQYLEVLEEGIRSGEFRETIQPFTVRTMIWGAVEHLVTRRSLLGKPADLLAMADEIFQTLFDGIRRPEDPPDIRVRLALDQNPNAKEEGA
jgi:AcrR family transcriptional regulator